MAFLELVDIHKSYRMGRNTVDVLKGVNLEIHDGEMATIVGPSGAGKSTLLHVMGALDRPTQGDVKLNMTNIFERSEKELAKFRNETIGFVFQFHHLLSEFTAFENVLMPALIARKKKEEIRDRAAFLLDKVGLSHRLSHKPGQLSGGEQQRVAVARALMNEPGLVLADEPSGNLDRKNAESLHQLMYELCHEQQKTFIIVTHNEELAELADVTVRLTDGQVFPYRKAQLAKDAKGAKDVAQPGS